LDKPLEKKKNRAIPQTIHKINSKCTRNLHIKSKTMEVSEENIGESLPLSSGHAERFSICEESSRHLKENVLKFHCMKIKIFTWEKNN
jgi:hypothetical protein